uniref:Putative secreted protein n=1 Tax=Panstrongylus lignarius TaxID=156445 RepID=A0A224Y2U7_9HEMI
MDSSRSRRCGLCTITLSPVVAAVMQLCDPSYFPIVTLPDKIFCFSCNVYNGTAIRQIFNKNNVYLYILVQLWARRKELKAHFRLK